MTCGVLCLVSVAYFDITFIKRAFYIATSPRLSANIIPFNLPWSDILDIRGCRILWISFKSDDSSQGLPCRLKRLAKLFITRTTECLEIPIHMGPPNKASRETIRWSIINPHDVACGLDLTRPLQNFSFVLW